MQKKEPWTRREALPCCSLHGDKPLPFPASIHLSVEQRLEQTRPCPRPCELPDLGSFVLFWESPHPCCPCRCSGETEEKQGWTLLQSTLENGQNSHLRGSDDCTWGSSEQAEQSWCASQRRQDTGSGQGNSQPSSSLGAQPLELTFWTQIPTFCVLSRLLPPLCLSFLI